MRAALTCVLLLSAAPVAAGTPLALAERQVVVLEFDRAVARVAVTDPDLVAARSAGARLTVTALKGGRASLEVVFADGASVVYDLAVDGARRPVAVVRPSGENDLDLAVAEVRSFHAPGVERVLVEENGVARVTVRGETVSVVGLAPGQASLVVVHAAGTKTTWQLRVR